MHEYATLSISSITEGEPGRSYIGVILSLNHKTRKVISEYVGYATKKQADYVALLRGFELAIKYNVKNLLVKSDSSLIIKQMSIDYNVDDKELKSLFLKAKQLESKFDVVRYIFVSEQHNQEAIKLANKALK